MNGAHQDERFLTPRRGWYGFCFIATLWFGLSYYTSRTNLSEPGADSPPKASASEQANRTVPKPAVPAAGKASPASGADGPSTASAGTQVPGPTPESTAPPPLDRNIGAAMQHLGQLLNPANAVWGIDTIFRHRFPIPEAPAAAGEPHQASGPLHVSLLKILTVVALSFLWFLTFLVLTESRHRRARADEHSANRAAEGGDDVGWFRTFFPHPWRYVFILVSILPSVPFVIAMHTAYEPAVFAMALAAIFVAAEHYCGLQTTERELRERTTELGDKTSELKSMTAQLEEGTTRLIDETADLQRSTTTLHNNVEDLGQQSRRLQEGMAIVLNADGLMQWRADVYRLYANAKERIDAVYRYFDIDAEWWMAAGSEEPWKLYETLCVGNPESLWTALKRSQASVQFIASFPLDDIPDGHLDEAEQGKYFRSLLGLVWNLVVFDRVRRGRRTPDPHDQAVPPLCIMLSRAPFWMHVVDDTVFQIIERGETVDSTVRELTYSFADEQPRRELSDWARDNVEQAAQRGGRAEEYVFSVLRYTALHSCCTENDALALGRMLDKLGLGTWLRYPKEEFLLGSSDKIEDSGQHAPVLSLESARDLCLAVFTEFLRTHMPHERAFEPQLASPVTPRLLGRQLL